MVSGRWGEKTSEHVRVSSYSHVVGGPRNTTPTEAFKGIITNFTVCRKYCPFNIC